MFNDFLICINLNLYKSKVRELLKIILLRHFCFIAFVKIIVLTKAIKISAVKVSFTSDVKAHNLAINEQNFKLDILNLYFCYKYVKV